jgi:hypothetical protein
MTNIPESSAAYSLSLPGPDEICRGEEGYRTPAPDIAPQVVFPVRPESARLKAYCYEEMRSDEIIAAVFQSVVN